MSYTWNQREARMWAAFNKAGMHKTAEVMYPGEASIRIAEVDFWRPDIMASPGAQSSDYEIEYQSADLPALPEAAQVMIDGELYRVRQVPRVEGLEASGFFRKAYLTKAASGAGCP